MIDSMHWNWVWWIVSLLSIKNILFNILFWTVLKQTKENIIPIACALSYRLYHYHRVYVCMNYEYDQSESQKWFHVFVIFVRNKARKNIYGYFSFNNTTWTPWYLDSFVFVVQAKVVSNRRKWHKCILSYWLLLISFFSRTSFWASKVT